MLLGILVGVLPGLGAPNGVSLLLPLTFTMDPVGGDHPAHQHVLGRAVRRLDHVDPVQHSGRAVIGRDHLRRLSDGEQGKAAQALSWRSCRPASARWSGVIVITLLSGWVAQFALQFSSPEFFAVYFLAFASFVGLGGASPAKTIVVDDARLRASRRWAWTRSRAACA